MKNREVARRFSLGLPGNAVNLRSNGAQLISYGTIIAYWDAGLHVNVRKYSKSTTCHQGLLWYAMQQAEQKGLPVVQYTGPEAKMWRSWRDDLSIRRARP